MFHLLKEGGGSHSGKGTVTQCLLSSFSGCYAVWQGELDLGLGKLHGVFALEVLRCDRGRSNDLDGARSCAVTARHFVVELADGTRQSGVSEFTVHVVGSTAAVVAQPNAVILDDARVLLHDLDTVQDFTRSLLHFAELVHVVPELGLGNDRVRCKDDHSVSFRVRVIFRGSLAADHLILTHNSTDSHSCVGKYGIAAVSENDGVSE